MEDTFTNVEDLAASVKAYINNRIAAAKLNASQKIAAVLSNLIAITIVAMVFLFLFGFASIGLAIILGEWIGEIWAGFLLVAVLWGLFGVLVWLTRKRIIQMPIMNAILQQLFKNDEAD